MKIKIIGSGGCVSTPRPLCQCRVCRQAREKGFPYARCGCSLYIEDMKLLIDTPEDIAYAINHSDIQEIDYILYSHIDPDHTMGMRIIEQLRLDWLAHSIGKRCENPIIVGSLSLILEELKCQGTKYGSALSYYESMNLVCLKALNQLNQGFMHLDLIPANNDGSVTIFVFSEMNKKVIYAPCDVKPFPDNPVFQNADYLIIGNTIVGDVLKDGFVLDEKNGLRNELFVMEEILQLKDKYNIKQVIITHLEEDWGKTYDDYLELQIQYEGVQFAFDGLEINY